MKIKPFTPFLKAVLGRNVTAITLWPFGVYITEEPMLPIVKTYLVNHETIHWHQQKFLPIVFYVLYFTEWLLRLPFGNAYMNISFEKEAYAHQKEVYMPTRFSFIKYL